MMNKDGLPGFSLQMVKLRLQQEFVKMENNSNKNSKNEEIRFERFKNLFDEVVSTTMRQETMDRFFESICDENLEFVQYEKFNRLCHKFFFIPGTTFKQKNDSENLYLVMTNLANNKASILQPVSLNLPLYFFIFYTFFRNKNH